MGSGSDDMRVVLSIGDEADRAETTSCAACKGRGKIQRPETWGQLETCPRCGGSGRRLVDERHAIAEVPAPHGPRCSCAACAETPIARVYRDGYLTGCVDYAARLSDCEAALDEIEVGARASWYWIKYNKPENLLRGVKPEPRKPDRGDAAAISAQLAKLSSLEPVLQFFQFAHLPETLQPHSAPFAELAIELVETLPNNPERRVALRKLLEAKDCAVRARTYKTGKAR